MIEKTFPGGSINISGSIESVSSFLPNGKHSAHIVIDNRHFETFDELNILNNFCRRHKYLPNTEIKTGLDPIYKSRYLMKMINLISLVHLTLL